MDFDEASWPPEDLQMYRTLGQNPTFHPKIPWNYNVWKLWFLWKMRFWKCEFCVKWDFEIVIFVKNEILKLWFKKKPTILKMWILSKMRFSKCEFWEKWVFENVNFVKNETLKMWILWKNELLKMWIFGWIANFSPVWLIRINLLHTKKVALIYKHKKCFLGGHGGLVLKQKKCICYLSLHPQSVAE